MQMTSYGGEAKSLALLAIKEAREGNIEKAEEEMKKADEALKKSHHAHANLLRYEADEENLQLSLFMVHAADHLSSADVVILLAEELIHLYKRVGRV